MNFNSTSVVKSDDPNSPKNFKGLSELCAKKNLEIRIWYSATSDRITVEVRKFQNEAWLVCSTCEDFGLIRSSELDIVELMVTKGIDWVEFEESRQT